MGEETKTEEHEIIIEGRPHSDEKTEVDMDLVWAAQSRPDIVFLATRFGQIRVRYRKSAQAGRRLVLVADGPNAIEHYDRLFDALAEDFSILVIEPPGYGFSAPNHAFQFTIDHHAEALHEVLDRLEIEKFMFAPSCAGVYPAMRFAERWPERVTHAILIQAAGWDAQVEWVPKIDPTGTLRKPSVGQVYAREHREELARSWYSVAIGDANRGTFVSTAHEGFCHGMCFCLASQIQGLFGLPRPDWRPLEIPAAIIWGLQDRSHKRTDKQTSLELASHATLHMWQDAGHSPELEYPDRFADLLRQLASG